MVQRLYPTARMSLQANAKEALDDFGHRVRHFAAICLPCWNTDLDSIRAAASTTPHFRCRTLASVREEHTPADRIIAAELTGFHATYIAARAAIGIPGEARPMGATELMVRVMH